MQQSVAGIALEGSRMLLGRRRPGGALGGLWEFPGGKVEPGESAKECLVREFREELDLSVTVGDHIAAGSFKHKGNSYHLDAYRVFLQDGTAVLREHLEIRWFNPAEIEAIPLAQSDSTLIPGILRYLETRGLE
jgi:8-oxo-dGTP diphosphatase